MQLHLGAAALVAFLLAFSRALSWLLVVSPFSNRAAVPTVATVAVAAGLALLALRSLGTSRVPLGTAGVAGALVLQIVTGLALGFVVQMLLSAVSSAGGLLALSGGLVLPPSMDPITGTAASLTSQFYEQVVLLLLFASNGYLVMVEGFVRSFSGPGYTLATSALSARVIVTDFGVFFLSALEIAAPILIVLFGAQVLLALLSKAAPQANVWLLGFPFQIFLLFTVMALTLSSLPNDITNLLARGLGDGLRLFGKR